MRSRADSLAIPEPWQHAHAGDTRMSRTCRRAPLVNATLLGGTILAFASVATQLLSLGLTRPAEITLAVAEPVATSFSRPDIIDRNGRLLATDVEAPSVFADPAIILDRDEVVEKLVTVLPDLDADDLRRVLSDKTRRFVWIRRGVSPSVAQRIHDLGLPGLSFRPELRRAYPVGELAGHVIGSVNVDNKGTAGIERFIDEQVGVDAVHSATLSTRAPVRLSLDLGVQHSLEDELDTAVRRFHTRGAAGLVLDIKTGEILASASLPRVDPGRSQAGADPLVIDKISAGTFELGSVFKTLTVAMALDEGLVTPNSVLDVREPLQAGRYTITDFHGAGRPLSVAEIFTHSSNVGAGMLALQAGPDRMTAFLGKLGLLQTMSTEAGMISVPQLPARWDRTELITVSYGHGLAVAPLQFSAAAAALFNNGDRMEPTYLKAQPGKRPAARKLVTPETSRQMARLFRLNVMDADGTGKRADVPGYRVGGKTGTADLASGGGYESKAVISSFLGAFPMDDPRYLTFVLLFEPKGIAETGGQRTASTNAAPVTGRLIARIAAQLGVEPLTVGATQ
jgi:cell division protein FtsI (penicillin-binding protein 3)